MLAVRPALDWGFGRPVRGLGCFATVLLVVGSGIGWCWAGAWIAGSRAARTLIQDQLVLEDLALRGLVAVAGEGDMTLAQDELTEQLGLAMDTAEGELRALIEEATAELELETSDSEELRQLFSSEHFDAVLDDLESRELMVPDRLAAVWAGGGFRQARDGRDAELATYADEVLATTESLRAESSRLISAVAWSSALPGPLVGFVLPLVLILGVAGLAHWLRSATVTESAT
jgi:hypothetical protein